MRIGIIGCGAIGSVLCRFIDQKLKGSRLVAICDIDKEKATALQRSLKSRPEITDIDGVIKKSEIVVEAVSPSIVRELLKKCIKKRKHLMVMSVCGLIQNSDLLDKLTARLFIPSGAVCGIDGVKAANIGNIESVTLTSIKNPRSLEGAPYIVKNKIDLKKIKKRRKIFEGSAAEAIKGFPRNINVSATLSLAGIGAKKTKVIIVVNPKIRRNTHEIEVIGSFGRLTAKTENVVSPLNPKSSHLAVLSACATLKRLTGNIKIGT
jgi:aspartate dehydrogenase